MHRRCMCMCSAACRARAVHALARSLALGFFFFFFLAAGEASPWSAASSSSRTRVNSALVTKPTVLAASSLAASLVAGAKLPALPFAMSAPERPDAISDVREEAERSGRMTA